MSATKFSSVNLSNSIQLLPIIPNNEAMLREEYPAAQWQAYERKCAENRDNRDYWVLGEDLEITIQLEAGGVWRLRLKAGWITDLGSVPTWARSIVSHSDPKFLLAYLVHDALFAIQVLEFESANNALDQIALLNRASGTKRFIVRQAVSFGGKSAWKTASEHVHYERKWCEFKWGHK